MSEAPKPPHWMLVQVLDDMQEFTNDLPRHRQGSYSGDLRTMRESVKGLLEQLQSTKEGLDTEVERRRRAERKNETLQEQVEKLERNLALCKQDEYDAVQGEAGLQEQYGTLHAAALALLESADDQTHPDDGFPIEEWLNLVDAVRGSNPASEPEDA